MGREAIISVSISVRDLWKMVTFWGQQLDAASRPTNYLESMPEERAMISAWDLLHTTGTWFSSGFGNTQRRLGIKKKDPYF